LRLEILDILTAGQEEIMKAVVAVIGKDTVGILAKVSGMCAEYKANVMDVTQTIMQDLFAMTMLIDISKLTIDYIDFADKLVAAGNEMGLQVHVMHEDIFNSMHKI
jgi:ACT domain-containing protein